MDKQTGAARKEEQLQQRMYRAYQPKPQDQNIDDRYWTYDWTKNDFFKNTSSPLDGLATMLKFSIVAAYLSIMIIIMVMLFGALPH